MEDISTHQRFRDMIAALESSGGVSLELGTVISASPLRFKVDNVALELDADDCVVCEHLAAHTRTAKVSGGVGNVSIAFDPALVAGDRIIVASTNNGQLYVILDRIGGV